MGKGKQETAPVSGGYCHDRDVDNFSFGGSVVCRAEDIDHLPSSHSFKNRFSDTNSPADLLFSNGRILPHTFPFENKGPLDSSPRPSCTSNSCSRSSSNSSRSNSSRRNLHQSSPKRPSNNFNPSSPKRPSDPAEANVRPISSNAYPRQAKASTTNASQARTTDILGRQGTRIKNQTRTKPAQENSGQGKGFFRSFVTACRECHALEPSSQVDRLPGKIGVHV